MDDPLQVLRRLRLLLAPGGVLVCSTPSLDSRLLAWFGPTWAHWHAPYHRHLFTTRGFRALAAQAGLHVRTLRTVSHPYWTSMTLAQQALGVEGMVSHDAKFDIGLSLRAQRYAFWAARWWDRRGEGDCMFVAMAEDERG
jgi:lambda repressor-like predicted transcriptional regulator